MASNHFRIFISSQRLVFRLAIVNAALQILAGLETADPATDLLRLKEVDSERIEPDSAEAPIRVTNNLYRSTAKLKPTAVGDLFLQAELTTFEYRDAESARAAFEAPLAGADLDRDSEVEVCSAADQDRARELSLEIKRVLERRHNRDFALSTLTALAILSSVSSSTSTSVSDSPVTRDGTLDFDLARAYGEAIRSRGTSHCGSQAKARL